MKNKTLYYKMYDCGAGIKYRIYKMTELYQRLKPLIQDYKKKERFSKNDDVLFKTTNKKLTKKRVDCFDKFLTE